MFFLLLFDSILQVLAISLVDGYGLFECGLDGLVGFLGYIDRLYEGFFIFGWRIDSQVEYLFVFSLQLFDQFVFLDD